MYLQLCATQLSFDLRHSSITLRFYALYCSLPLFFCFLLSSMVVSWFWLSNQYVFWVRIKHPFVLHHCHSFFKLNKTLVFTNRSSIFLMSFLHGGTSMTPAWGYRKCMLMTIMVVMEITSPGYVLVVLTFSLCNRIKAI